MREILFKKERKGKQTNLFPESKEKSTFHVCVRMCRVLSVETKTLICLSDYSLQGFRRVIAKQSSRCLLLLVAVLLPSEAPKDKHKQAGSEDPNSQIRFHVEFRIDDAEEGREGAAPPSISTIAIP